MSHETLPFQKCLEESPISGILGKQTVHSEENFARFAQTLDINTPLKWILESLTEEKKSKTAREASREVNGLLLKRTEIRDKEISNKKQNFSESTLQILFI